MLANSITHMVKHRWHYKKETAADRKFLSVYPFQIKTYQDFKNFPRFAKSTQDVNEMFYAHYTTEEGTVIPFELEIRSSWIDLCIGYIPGGEKCVEIVLDAIRKACPIEQADAPDTIPVAFWVLGSDGPYSTLRQIDAPKYSDIRDNYDSKTQEFLDALVKHKPSKGGELLLLSGDPGTGKTYALRSLFRSWKDWATFHYIVDPLTLFGGSPEYLMKLLLGAAGDSKAPWEDEDEEISENEKWRIILIEDAAELISTDAKERVGQGLAQLLNVTEGLLGQGLKIMVFITTNEKVGNLHPAISRPGRCSFHHDFGKLSEDRSKDWLEAKGLGPKFDGKKHTIAELYALMNEDANQGQFGQVGPSKKMGFTNG
jgi:hypothetical protein